MKNKVFITLLVVVCVSFGYVVSLWVKSSPVYRKDSFEVQTQDSFLTPSTVVHSPNRNSGLPDLTYGAEKAVHSVVHIKSFVKDSRYSQGDIFDRFFGAPNSSRFVEGAGSGVIVSSDGYIVTNNHVVKDAENVIVVMNDREELEAEIVGTDPSTDLALLKIDKESLPSLRFGSSNDLRLGEWVMAIGNPFALTSTVTAGIVSAKSRDIPLIRGLTSINSFIQTDAAVNPGNSGGALVNAEGDLVGINTAIVSRSGEYTGYSFAIPSETVRKVVEDLREYGKVKRVFLGVQIVNLNATLAEERGLDITDGVLVSGVTQGMGADKAGIKPGDVIIAVQGKRISKTSQLQETITTMDEGEEVIVTIHRDGREIDLTVTLASMDNDAQVLTGEALWGATFEPISDVEKEKYELYYGVKVKSINEGAFKEKGVKIGFIITEINKIPIKNTENILSLIRKIQKGKAILFEGIDVDGIPAYFVIKK